MPFLNSRSGSVILPQVHSFVKVRYLFTVTVKKLRIQTAREALDRLIALIRDTDGSRVKASFWCDRSWRGPIPIISFIER